jgi:hypothetical protein
VLVTFALSATGYVFFSITIVAQLFLGNELDRAIHWASDLLDFLPQVFASNSNTEAFALHTESTMRASFCHTVPPAKQTVTVHRVGQSSFDSIDRTKDSKPKLDVHAEGEAIANLRIYAQP